MNASTNSNDPAQPSAAHLEPTPVPIVYEIDAAELTESGTWCETQVIEGIKDANDRRKCPNRALSGHATMRIGSRDIAGGPMVGQLILTKRRKRTRIRRFLSYLSA